MNYKDVIETLKKCFMPACDYHVVNRCNLSLEERFMKHSDVLDMSIESIEKQIPKKVIKKKVNYGSPYYCPCCEAELIPVEFIDTNSKGIEKVSWCWHCGNKLDWSEVEE